MAQKIFCEITAPDVLGHNNPKQTCPFAFADTSVCQEVVTTFKKIKILNPEDRANFVHPSVIIIVFTRFH